MVIVARFSSSLCHIGHTSMLLEATFAITPIACAVPGFATLSFGGLLPPDEPGLDLDEPGLGPATSLPGETGIGVRGVRGVRALPGGVGPAIPAGPSGVRPRAAKLRRAEMD